MATFPSRIPDDYHPTEEDMAAHQRVVAWEQRMKHRMAVRRGDFEVFFESGNYGVVRTRHDEEPMEYEDIAQLYERVSGARIIRHDDDGRAIGVEFGMTGDSNG